MPERRGREIALVTLALADRLIRLRERVALSETDIRRATGADRRTVRAWLARGEAPAGMQAARPCELIAVVKRLESTQEPTAI